MRSSYLHRAVITGVSGDDPSGIGTYAQSRAQYGRLLNGIGWATTIVMDMAAIDLIVTTILG